MSFETATTTPQARRKNPLELIGESFPQSRQAQILLGSIVGVSVVLNQPQIALASVFAAMGARAWLNWRNNDLVEECVPAYIETAKTPADDYGIIAMMESYGMMGARLIDVMPGAVLNRYIIQLPPGTQSKDLPNTDDMAMALPCSRRSVSSPAGL